jgi:hypothetical protein
MQNLFLFNFLSIASKGSFSIPTRKWQVHYLFLFIYPFIVSFNRSNSFRKHSKFEHPTGSSEAGTNFNNFKFDLWVSKSFNFKILSESFRIP